MSVFIIMGVSGCGKSTIGRLLADKMGLPFLEGDDFHPATNKQKMAQGQALTNADRESWIAAIAKKANEAPSCVLACSALNQTVRAWLDAQIFDSCVYIFLNGDPALIAKRLSSRQDHFFDPALLTSQFEALEQPENAYSVNIDQPIEDVVAEILRHLNHD